MTDDPLELESRRRLYRRIRARPGEYLRELQRETGLAMGALEYHLGELERSGLVTVLQDANKRYFPADMDRRDKPVLAFLRQTLPRRVLVLVLREGPVSKARLVAALDVPVSTLNHHLRKLVEVGLLQDVRDSREATYAVADPDRVLRLLVAQQATFVDRWVDNLLAGIDALR